MSFVFQYLRESELKHGRMAMLAIVGLWACKLGIHFDGLGYETTDFKAQLGEFIDKNPYGFAQVMVFIGATEGKNNPEGAWTGEMTRPVGEYGSEWGSGFLKGKSDAQVNDMKLKELKNGRLAMMAMAAIFAESAIPGSVPPIADVF